MVGFPAALDRYHTQTQGSYVPWLYTAESAFSFLEGRAVQLIDAESFCDDDVCTLIRENDEETDPNASNFSLGTVVKKTPEDGIGTLFSGSIPDEVPRGVEIEILLIMKATGLENSSNKQLVTELVLSDRPPARYIA